MGSQQQNNKQSQGDAPSFMNTYARNEAETEGSLLVIIAKDVL
jgi:hypothetical protein